MTKCSFVINTAGERRSRQTGVQLVNATSDRHACALLTANTGLAYARVEQMLRVCACCASAADCSLDVAWFFFRMTHTTLQHPVSDHKLFVIQFELWARSCSSAITLLLSRNSEYIHVCVWREREFDCIVCMQVHACTCKNMTQYPSKFT